jgi:hypothetical protein
MPALVGYPADIALSDYYSMFSFYNNFPDNDSPLVIFLVLTNSEIDCPNS